MANQADIKLCFHFFISACIYFNQ